jgi:Pex2 / Pex12 amino terminal region/Zinc finger, C3HC4 type (RING finger)
MLLLEGTCFVMGEVLGNRSHAAGLQNLRLAADGRGVPRLFALATKNTEASSLSSRPALGGRVGGLARLAYPSIAQKVALGFLVVVLRWVWARAKMVAQARNVALATRASSSHASAGAGGAVPGEDVASRLRRLREAGAAARRRPEQDQGSLRTEDGGAAETQSRWSRLLDSPALWPSVQRVDAIVKLLSVANFAAFLLNGRYPTLAHRVLGLRYVWAGPSAARVLSFEYMNRQLVWQGFTEFLMFAVPLLASSGVRRWTSRLANRARSLKDFATLSPKPSAALAEETSHLAESAAQCPICESEPTCAHVGECGHLFCYWCVASVLAEEPDYRCPTCHVRVGADPPRATARDMHGRGGVSSSQDQRAA